jgi:hypothetical protein
MNRGGKVKGADAALDRALEELVTMRGGQPGVIAIVQHDKHAGVHRFEVAELDRGRRPHASNYMRVATSSSTSCASPMDRLWNTGP